MTYCHNNNSHLKNLTKTHLNFPNRFEFFSLKNINMQFPVACTAVWHFASKAQGNFALKWQYFFFIYIYVLLMFVCVLALMVILKKKEKL